MLDEFKNFTMRGNVVDMAVGTSPIKVGKFFQYVRRPGTPLTVSVRLPYSRQAFSRLMRDADLTYPHGNDG